MTSSNPRLITLHNKTNEIAEEELPFNPRNCLLSDENLRELFDANGLAGIQYRNLNIYRTAFVHRSYVLMKNTDFATGNQRCPPGCLPLQEMSYDRLEFVGDAILGMIVGRYLYERYPSESEGFLSKLRVKLVNGHTLGTLADKLGLGRYLILSRQIENRDTIKILEDVLEAFIGAIFMDFNTEADQPIMPENLRALPLISGAGYYAAEHFIVTVLERHIDFADLIKAKTNYKDTLVTHARNIYSFYEISVDTLPSGVKNYKICVKDRSGRVLGIGEGPSKKQGENAAAKAALEYLGISTEQTVMR